MVDPDIQALAAIGKVAENAKIAVEWIKKWYAIGMTILMTVFLSIAIIEFLIIKNTSKKITALNIKQMQYREQLASNQITLRRLNERGVELKYIVMTNYAQMIITGSNFENQNSFRTNNFSNWMDATREYQRLTR